MITIAGWVLWGIFAVHEVVTLPDAFKPVKPLENTTRWGFVLQTALGAISLVTTALLPISKLNLIWMYPVIIFSPRIAAKVGMSLFPILFPKKWAADYAGKAAEEMRAELEATYGSIWTLPEIKQSYILLDIVRPFECKAGYEQIQRVMTKAGFAADEAVWSTPRGEMISQELYQRRYQDSDEAGMVIVTRREDGVQGSFLFKEKPRFYFSPSESVGGDYGFYDDEEYEDEDAVDESAPAS